MDMSDGMTPEKINSHLQRIAKSLASCYPKAVLLFGSTVSFLNNPETAPAPNDLDILLVSDNPLIGIGFQTIEPVVELHRFRTSEVLATARSLRYDRKAVAIAKLYAKNVARMHARDIILASLLLGPSYNAFGIEQIDVGGNLDTRDYSRHIVLCGHDWWQRLSVWARQRRRLFQRLSDRAIFADRFE